MPYREGSMPKDPRRKPPAALTTAKTLRADMHPLERALTVELKLHTDSSSGEGLAISQIADLQDDLAETRNGSSPPQ